MPTPLQVILEGDLLLAWRNVSLAFWYCEGERSTYIFIHDKCKELPQVATPPPPPTVKDWGPCAQLRELWACAITNS